MPAYKSERGTYYASFYYTDWTGKRKKKKKEGFKTKREAQAFERQFIEQQAGAPTMTFGSLYSLYKADGEQRLKKSTMFARCAIVERHILPAFKDTAINEITPAAVRAWQNDILKQGYSINYCGVLHRYLAAILNFAIRYYGLASNPATKAGAIGRTEPRQDFWTVDEFRCFAMTLRKPQHIMLFYLLFWTGCRVGEVLALTWDDIGADYIDINKTVSRIHGQKYVRPPKTRESIRTVKVPSFISAMLDDYRRMSAHAGPQLFHIANVTVNDIMRRHVKKAGVKLIRVHDLRHSHASMLIQAGVPVIAIAERLGHKNAQTTLKIYSHLYKSTKDNVVSVLESM